MKVLVTGASGMLGRGLAGALVGRGDDVTVMQRRPAGVPCREVLGDVADPGAVMRAVAGQDVVIHAAAKVDVVGRWSQYEQANHVGTRNVVDACLRAGVARLVQVSSPSVAHAGHALVAAGAAPADPAGARGHYARSKALAERDALRAAGDDLAVLAIRPHLVWGPGDTQLVGRIVERARSGRLPRIGSGAALIDTTYLDNAVDALIAAADRCADLSGQALVVSNGEPRPVAEIIDRLCLAGGAPLPARRLPTPVAAAAGSVIDQWWVVSGRTETPPLTRFLAEQLSTAHWFDQRGTRAALQWSPRVPLDEGFAALGRWYQTPADA